MQYAVDLCRLYARTPWPVVFVGPVGSGKSAMAHELHRTSSLKGPFVAVGSGDLAPTLFRDHLFGRVAGAYTDARTARAGAIAEAAGGTLLLDDLAFMALEVQSAILGVMETRRYRPLGSERELIATARFLFASTVDLQELFARGSLLPDLKSRLGEFVVSVPSLLEREVDILPLALHLAERAVVEAEGRSIPVELEPCASKLLASYAWPENVRELKNVMRRAVLHAGVHEGRVRIRGVHLPDRIQLFDPADRPRRTQPSLGLIQYTLQRVKGNKSEAARRLYVHANTIHNRLAATHRREVHKGTGSST
jgi:DNA-binding NtrC family response regulator